MPNKRKLKLVRNLSILAMFAMASTTAFAAPTVQEILDGAAANTPQTVATESNEYMPQGCISQKDGCCLITAEEYNDMLIAVDNNKAVSAKQQAFSEDGKRRVERETVNPSFQF